MYGKGLNSIRARFTLLIGGFCLIGAVVMALFVAPHPTTVYALAGEVALIALLCIVPAAITYVMAGNLVGSIHALKRSTEAIVNGDMDRPVEVDCSCEVGGLADSFRKMVGKLNSNIMRMNILAYNDPLTGLANRVVIQHMLALSLDGRHETPFRGAVLFIDLDGFKVINDSHGHEVGDELLRAASQRIVERGLGRTTETLDNCTTPFGEGPEGVEGHRALQKIRVGDATTSTTKVLCLVYTHSNRHDRVRAIAETYAPRCDGFLAASNLTDLSIGAVDITHEGPESCKYNRLLGNYC